VGDVWGAVATAAGGSWERAGLFGGRKAQPGGL